MEERSSSVSAKNSIAEEQNASAATGQQSASLESAAVSSEKVGNEPRKAYGTAKTEDLRDSGVWRYLLSALVILCCLALLAIPLIILIPLLSNSLDVHAAANQAHISLTWLWILMIAIEIAIAAVIIRGLTRIFWTQAGNYRR